MKQKINTFNGTIIKALPPKKVYTKNKHSLQEAKMWISDESVPDGVSNIEVTITGENVNYTGCEGARVQCKYWTRVFTFTNKQTGMADLGSENRATEIHFQ